MCIECNNRDKSLSECDHKPGHIIDYLSEDYSKTLMGIHKRGIEISPRGLKTKEHDAPGTWTLEDGRCFPAVLCRGRRLNPYFAIFECLWMWSGRQCVDSLAKYNSTVRQFSDDGEVFYGAYGHRAVHHFDQDQIAIIIRMLTEDPDSRRAVLGIWDPREDLTAKSKDIPCNNLVTFRRRGTWLDMIVNRRSNDIVLGLPYNFIQFWWLHNMIASSVPGVKARYAMHVISSLHLYLDAYGSKHNETLLCPSNYLGIDITRFNLTYDDFGRLTYKDTKAASCAILDNDGPIPLSLGPIVDSYGCYKKKDFDGCLFALKGTPYEGTPFEFLVKDFIRRD